MLFTHLRYLYAEFDLLFNGHQEYFCVNGYLAETALPFKLYLLIMDSYDYSLSLQLDILTKCSNREFPSV